MFLAWIARYPECTKFALINSIETHQFVLRDYPEGVARGFDSRWLAAEYLECNLTDYELYALYTGTGRQATWQLSTNFIYTVF